MVVDDDDDDDVVDDDDDDGDGDDDEYRYCQLLPTGKQTWLAGKWSIEIGGFPFARNLHSLRGDFPARHV